MNKKGAIVMKCETRIPVVLLSMFVFLCALSAAASFPPIYLLDTSTESTPPPQSNLKSCQSNFLAVSLALLKQTVLLNNNDFTALEQKIRAKIESIASGEPTHQDWKKAVEEFTNQEYTLSLVYKNSEEAALKEIGDTLAAGAPVVGTSVNGIFDTKTGSVATYGYGHVVSIFDAAVASSPQKLTIFNSCTDRSGKLCFLAGTTEVSSAAIIFKPFTIGGSQKYGVYAIKKK
jgi:hypothetical protein